MSDNPIEIASVEVPAEVARSGAAVAFARERGFTNVRITHQRIAPRDKWTTLSIQGPHAGVVANIIFNKFYPSTRG